VVEEYRVSGGVSSRIWAKGAINGVIGMAHLWVNHRWDEGCRPRALVASTLHCERDYGLVWITLIDTYMSEDWLVLVHERQRSGKGNAPFFV
jgi:hypothetical protein